MKGEWEWIYINPASATDINALNDMPQVDKNWMESLQEEKNSNLEMETTIEGEEFIWGSIIYHQDIENQSEQTVLQYSLSHHTLITSEIDFSLIHNLTEEQMNKKIQKAGNAIEGFMIFLGEIVASYLQGIDAFENETHDLLWRIKSQNNEDVLDQLMDSRHEVLIWRNLIIPIMEIRDAVQEAYGEDIANSPHYKRTSRRIDRCRSIINEYAEEVREMIELETVISSHRGNEIVKTLTVITVLFSPVTAWGALWAMRFEFMPEVQWKFGYPFSILVILLSTGALYYYLKKKDWIGSVLKNPKDKKF
ncbi:magnesium transporter CorA family protein [Planococcus shenhongbingii]|uniref:magnesium transporter CorA family protein n=1 Tax=Planococcus shenhongbingii TaxID=3058398 RepID=UPI00345DE611